MDFGVFSEFEQDFYHKQEGNKENRRAVHVRTVFLSPLVGVNCPSNALVDSVWRLGSQWLSVWS